MGKFWHKTSKPPSDGGGLLMEKILDTIVEEQHKTDEFGNITCVDGSIIYTSKTAKHNPDKAERDVIFNNEYFILAMNEKTKQHELVSLDNKTAYVNSIDKALALLKVYKGRMKGENPPKPPTV